MLIESENLIARIDKCYQESAKTGLGLEPVMAIRDIKALISIMPTVDAAPVVHGRWEWFDDEELKNILVNIWLNLVTLMQLFGQQELVNVVQLFVKKLVLV